MVARASSPSLWASCSGNGFSVQGELDSKNKALFFFTPEAYSIVLIFANFRPGAYSVVLIYIFAESVPLVLISGI